MFQNLLNKYTILFKYIPTFLGLDYRKALIIHCDRNQHSKNQMKRIIMPLNVSYVDIKS